MFTLWGLLNLNITVLDNYIFDFQPFQNGTINYVMLSFNAIERVKPDFMTKMNTLIANNKNFFVLDLSKNPLTKVPKKTFMDFMGKHMILYYTQIPPKMQRDISTTKQSSTKFVWNKEMFEYVSTHDITVLENSIPG